MLAKRWSNLVKMPIFRQKTHSKDADLHRKVSILAMRVINKDRIPNGVLQKAGKSQSGESETKNS